MQSLYEITNNNKRERQELQARIERLETFLQTEDFQRTDENSQRLLFQQYEAMRAYSAILLKRIIRGNKLMHEADKPMEE